MDSDTLSDLNRLKAKMVAAEKKVINVDVIGISLIPTTRGKTTCVRIPWNAGRNIPDAINQACNFLSLLFLICMACRMRTTIAPITITEIQYRCTSSIVPGCGILTQPQGLSKINAACSLLATYTTSKTIKGP